MTASVESIIAAVLGRHPQPVFGYSNESTDVEAVCPDGDCGWHVTVTSREHSRGHGGRLYAAHQAAAVLAALVEAGTVEWGTETVHETTGAVLDRDVWQTEKTAREVNRKYGDRVVTRLVTPWVSAE